MEGFHDSIVIACKLQLEKRSMFITFKNLNTNMHVCKFSYVAFPKDTPTDTFIDYM